MLQHEYLGRGHQTPSVHGTQYPLLNKVKDPPVLHGGLRGCWWFLTGDLKDEE